MLSRIIIIIIIFFFISFRIESESWTMLVRDAPPNIWIQFIRIWAFSWHIFGSRMNRNALKY